MPNSKLVKGAGCGTRQWVPPFSLTDNDGADVFAVDENGNVTCSGTLTAGATVSSGGNVDLPGTLDVTGATTLDSTLSVAGAATMSAALKLSLETGITAYAGGGQANATALSATKTIHNVTVVATAADSVKLPAATGSGAIHLIKNSDAAESLQLFAAATETIDGVASATGVAIAAGKARLVCDIAAGAWVSLYGA